MGSKKVAVVGGGVSGIGCLWALRDSGHEAHLYEADDRLGGHANTVQFEKNGCYWGVDTGFIAMNRETYPNFYAFLASLGVPITATDMSFSVSMDGGMFEWASTSIGGFLAQLSNIFRPWFWRLVFDILRFNLFAAEILSSDEYGSVEKSRSRVDDKRPTPICEGESIGSYLERHCYSPQFRENYIIPMVAAPWCIDPDEFSNRFPAKDLIEFMLSHALLDTMWRTLRWHTIETGSVAYVDAFMRSLQPDQHLHLGAAVQQIDRQSNGKIRLTVGEGSREEFDHVILAVHANQALKALGKSATASEKDILSNFHTTRNVCVLHSDESLLPRRPAARASWNCMMQSMPPTQHFDEKSSLIAHADHHYKPYHTRKISVTFDMNRLQGIPNPGLSGSPGRVLVSLNPIRQPQSVHSEYIYHHPLFSSDSFSAQKRLCEINGTAGISYAGAWMGYGFHEDGFTAGLQAARHLQGCRPLILPTLESGSRWALAERTGKMLVRNLQRILVLFSRQ